MADICQVAKLSSQLELGSIIQDESIFTAAMKQSLSSENSEHQTASDISSEHNNDKFTDDAVHHDVSHQLSFLKKVINDKRFVLTIIKFGFFQFVLKYLVKCCIHPICRLTTRKFPWNSSINLCHQKLMLTMIQVSCNEILCTVVNFNILAIASIKPTKSSKYHFIVVKTRRVRAVHYRPITQEPDAASAAPPTLQLLSLPKLQSLLLQNPPIAADLQQSTKHHKQSQMQKLQQPIVPTSDGNFNNFYFTKLLLP